MYRVDQNLSIGMYWPIILNTGYLDDKPQISDEDILIRLQAFLSNYTTSQVEAESFLKQFWRKLQYFY